MNGTPRSDLHRHPPDCRPRPQVSQVGEMSRAPMRSLCGVDVRIFVEKEAHPASYHFRGP